jgi:hypothetical protein
MIVSLTSAAAHVCGIGEYVLVVVVHGDRGGGDSSGGGCYHGDCISHLRCSPRLRQEIRFPIRAAAACKQRNGHATRFVSKDVPLTMSVYVEMSRRKQAAKHPHTHNCGHKCSVVLTCPTPNRSCACGEIQFNHSNKIQPQRTLDDNLHTVDKCTSTQQPTISALAMSSSLAGARTS